MAWIVITILFALIGGAAFFIGVGSADRYMKAWGLGIFGVLSVVWLIVTFVLSIHAVGQRQVGIVYGLSGAIEGQKGTGVVMTAPWQHIRTENIGIQKEVFEFGQGNSAVSKDQQPIFATLVVNVQIETNDVLPLYKSVGPNWKAILLDGRVPQDFKETTAQFTSPEITLNRPRLRTVTLGRLKQELCPKTVGEPFCITVADVFVQNVGYSQAYTQAIEEKQVQVQRAQQAQAKVAQAQAEADQVAATASGDARATLTKAIAEAKAINLKGKALKDNPSFINLEAVEKLNPNATVVICTGSGQGNCPSFLPQTAVSGG